MIKKFASTTALIISATLAVPAFAGPTTYTATAGSGLTFDAIADGSGHLGAMVALCDGTALANCLGINGSGQLTIANTAFAATQSGTWTVEPGNTVNTTAWLVTGAGGVFPATESGTWNVGLSAGSNTVGKVDLLGNAGGILDTAPGTSATQALGIQGVSGGVAVPITASVLPLPSGAATATNQTNVQAAISGATAPADSIITGGVYNTTLPTLTNGQAAAVQLDSSGRPIISPSTLTIAQGATTSGQTGSLVMGAASTSAPTDTTGNSYPLSLDTLGNLRVNVAAGGLTAALGTTGGWTPGVQAALSTTVESIKSSAGQLGKMLCYNPNSSTAYVQIFNIASGSVTLGSSVAVDVVPIPATLNGGFTLPLPGEQFSTAISFAATTTATGSTAPATALTCSYVYN